MSGIIFDVMGLGGSFYVDSPHGDAGVNLPPGRESPAELSAFLRLWFLHPSRPWSAHLSAMTLGVEEDAAGRLRFVLTPTGVTFTYLEIDLELMVGVRVGVLVAGTPAATVAATVASMTWERWDLEGGSRARTHSWRVGHPAGSHQHPSLELGLTLQQSWALSEAMRVTPQPRKAYVWDEVAEVWRRVVVGRIDQRPHVTDDPTRMLATVEVIGTQEVLF